MRRKEQWQRKSGVLGSVVCPLFVPIRALAQQISKTTATHCNLTLHCNFLLLAFQLFQARFNFLFKAVFACPSWCLFTISLIGVIEFKVSFTTFFALNFQGARFLEAFHTQKIAHDNQDVNLHCCFRPNRLTCSLPLVVQLQITTRSHKLHFPT